MHWFCSNLFSEPDILIWGCTGAHWNITKKVSSANLLQPSSKQAIDRDTHTCNFCWVSIQCFYFIFLWFRPSGHLHDRPHLRSSPTAQVGTYPPPSTHPPPPSPHLITKTLIFYERLAHPVNQTIHQMYYFCDLS